MRIVSLWFLVPAVSCALVTGCGSSSSGGATPDGSTGAGGANAGSGGAAAGTSGSGGSAGTSTSAGGTGGSTSAGGSAGTSGARGSSGQGGAGGSGAGTGGSAGETSGSGGSAGEASGSGGSAGEASGSGGSAGEASGSGGSAGAIGGSDSGGSAGMAAGGSAGSSGYPSSVCDDNACNSCFTGSNCHIVDNPCNDDASCDPMENKWLACICIANGDGTAGTQCDTNFAAVNSAEAQPIIDCVKQTCPVCYAKGPSPKPNPAGCAIAEDDCRVCANFNCADELEACGADTTCNAENQSLGGCICMAEQGMGSLDACTAGSSAGVMAVTACVQSSCGTVCGL